jgi:hypothetical protein
MRILIGKLLQLVTGGLLGCVLGGILTGSENYWIALAIGVPILFTVAGFFGATGASKRKAAGEPVLRPGIISTIPGMGPPKLRESVLNPVSTAVPSAGVVLNGEVVGGTGSAATPAAAATGSATRLGWRALSILTLALGAALVLLPSYQTIGWFFSDAAQGHPFDGRDMTVGLHQQDAFDQIVDVMGSTEVVSIHFYENYITVSAPTTPGARTVDLFQWRDGFASRQGADYSQPSDLRGELFDAGDIDISLVADLVRQSIADAKLQSMDGVYPAITRYPGDQPQISVALSGVYFDAYYTYSVTGELIQRSGSAFD